MKKIVSMLLSVIALFTLAVPAFAATIGDSRSAVEPSSVVVTREDVSLADAIKDATFDPALAQLNPEFNSGTKAVTWNVWGTKVGGTPYGYSEHKNGSTILSTYHYTRTFLGSANDPRGDSGRIWGTYTVLATGTYCIQDVWDLFIHRVYYGTED